MRKSKIVNAEKVAELRPMPRRTFRRPWSKHRFKWVIAYGKKPDYHVSFRLNVVTIKCDGNPLAIARLAGEAGESMDFHAIVHPEELRRSENLRFRPLQFSHPVRGAFRVYSRGKDMQMLCPHCLRQYLSISALSKHLIKVHRDTPTAKSIDCGVRFDAAKNRVKPTGLKTVKGVKHV